MTRKNKKGVAAVLPVYVKGKGNCCEIWTKDGERNLVERTCPTIMRNICRHYQLDLKAAQEANGKYLELSKQVPIYVREGLTLVWIKIRIPKFKSDGAYGYVNMWQVEDLKEDPDNEGQTLLKLKSGDVIKVLSKLSTVRSNLRKGKLITENNRRKRGLVKEIDVERLEKMLAYEREYRKFLKKKFSM